MTYTSIACPYCGRALQRVARRWSGRDSLACSRCGEFPDLAPAPGAARINAEYPVAAPLASAAHDDGRPRVLLVDDSAEYRELYTLMLEQTATVITASRGEDGLTIAETQPLDAIVLDVMMPGMDGWRTCERLKASPLTSGIPVIMLTSLDGLDVPARAGQAGAAGVLIKPCAAERLRFAIATALERRFGGSRRWHRTTLRAPLRAHVDDLPASIVNVSYGGLCVQVDHPLHGVAASFDLTVPSANGTMRADGVWRTGDTDDLWVCGAQITQGGETWRSLVDAAS